MGFVVTLDGPAGSGKSSVAKRLAERLDFNYLDTGALYRAIACCMDRNGIAPDENARFMEYLGSMRVRIDGNGVFVNGEDVAALIRSPRVDSVVSAYSALKPVRGALLGLQRDQANHGNLVTDGRDMGTVVFPEANVKFFLTATPEARAERRYKELLKKGEPALYDEVLAQMRERDRIDAGREFAPLKEPIDSIHVDTSDMTVDEVVDRLTDIVKEGLGV
ncbi:MAG: (d)CMP kinase [Synergistaceae bacterium]|nr:(d)CMP kinase [Synergistaceae bacterium]